MNSLPAEPQGKPKNTGVGSLSILQRIFQTQKLNQCLLHCRQILYQLSHQATPIQMKRWVLFVCVCVCVCVCVWVCVCVCVVAPPSTFLQWVRVNMSSASAGGSASSSHTCLLIWAAKMEPYGYLWTFNRSKAFSSKSQFIGLLYSHGISAF